MSARSHRHSQPSYHHQLKLPASLSTRPTARNLGQSRPYPAARPSRSNRASATRSSRSLDEGSSSDLVAISFYGYVETVLDSLLLVEVRSCYHYVGIGSLIIPPKAFRRGSIQGLTGRIPANQRERLIRSGSTFIFLESATDIRRWTDGKVKFSPCPSIASSFLTQHFFISLEVDPVAGWWGIFGEISYPRLDLAWVSYTLKPGTGLSRTHERGASKQS